MLSVERYGATLSASYVIRGAERGVRYPTERAVSNKRCFYGAFLSDVIKGSELDVEAVG